MAEEIVIKTVLVLDDSGKRRLQQDVGNALNSSDVQAKARDAGRKMGDALNLGIETTRRSREEKELAHMRRLEAISAQSAARIQEIERRKQAQLDLIRERAVQKEIEDQRKIEREMQRVANSAGSLRLAIAGISGAFGVLAGLGIVSLFERVGRAAVEAAIDIDRQVNTLKALTGSAEAAQQRFAELFALAQKTPGLTTNLALTLDAQLRVLSVSEQTINRLLPAIGRLNAISPLGDPAKFASNFIQLATQNFERQDLKELVGQSPFAGQLIKEIFNVDNPTNAKAIRDAAQRLGITTVERLSEEFAKAAENNPILQSVTESLGGQFEKLRDRLNVALAPLGKEVAKTLIPIFDELVKAVEKYGDSAARVFAEHKNDIIATAREIGTLAVQLGKLIGQIADLGARSGVFKFLAVNVADIQDVLAGDVGLFNFNKGPRQRAVEAKFAVLEREAAAVRNSPFLGSPERQALDGRGATGDFGSGGNNRGRGGGASGSGARDARALRDAQIAFTKDQAENELKIVKDINERGLKDLQDLYERSKITVKDYYEFKQNLAVDTLDQELRLLDREAAAITKSLGSAKGAERIRDEAKLNDVLTRQTLKRKEILDVIEATGREFKKSSALSPITAEQVQVIDREALDREKRVADLRQQALQFGVEDIELRRQELQIQNAVNRGALTEAEGRQAILATQRQFRDVMIESLKAQERLATDPQQIAQIRLQIEQIQTLGVEFSNAQRFARGFGSQIETVGDAFERLGQNVSRALMNTRDLLGGLKQAVLGFFNDLLGQSLQNVLRQVFAPIVGITGGGAAGSAGGIGGIFRTPGTFPASIAQAFAGVAGGGGISAPPSVSQSGLGGILGGIFGGGGGVARTPARSDIDDFFGANVPRTAGKIGGGFSLSSIGKSLGAAAPFLGFSAGSGLGGQSLAGNILGGIGGALGGLVAGAATGGITGALGSAFALSGTLGPLALAAAPLLIVGGILLGKAKQRRQDEEASGQFLTQALNSIEQLASGVASGQIDGSQARSIFDTQILGTFRQQIGTLKTKSVRDSRLTNQVRDLENVYQARIPPLIADQQRKAADAARFAAIDSRLVPQFRTGGLVPGVDRGRDSVLALLTPGELVLNRTQQASVIRDGGPGVFERAGVPRTPIQVGQAQAFQFGGIAQPSSFAQSGGAMVINLEVQLGMTEKDTQEVVARGINSRTGEDIVVNVVQRARGRGRRV
jgi:hypothetical protein